MKTISSPANMRRFSEQCGRRRRTVALVPTMGALHEGHISLMRLARRRADILVVSIFVNPTQFGPREDYRTYPRNPSRDSRICRKAGVDVLFRPRTSDMYRAGFSSFVEETALSRGLCGKSRPGHFRGVATVVAKLFNIVRPDVAIFGRKDAQQLGVVNRIARDLDFPVRIVAAPTVRAPDGLALSSRNVRLNAERRRDALCLFRALRLARSLCAKGERNAGRIVRRMLSLIRSVPSGKVEYAAIVDPDTLRPVKRIRGNALAILAARIGGVRLIDNSIISCGGGRR